MVVLFCVDNNWLVKDPIANFKMTKEEIIPQFLTKEEIQVLSDKKIVIERLRQVPDVFSCFPRWVTQKIRGQISLAGAFVLLCPDRALNALYWIN